MESLGKYLLFLQKVCTRRGSFRTCIKHTLSECAEIGVGSLGIVVVVSAFIGAVTSIQVRYNLQSPLAKDFLVGYSVRNMTLLEMSPTVIAIVFAGRVGSSIAGQLGSMRISEQIDALEVMGLNSASYLVFPKILASMLMYPLLVIISAFTAIYSGLIAAQQVVHVLPSEYIFGLRYKFDMEMVRFALYKALTYGFLVASISAYRGFYISGGAVSVGRASTRAVTESCAAILLADYVLTQLILHPG